MTSILLVDVAIRDEAHRRLSLLVEKHRSAVRPVYRQSPKRADLVEAVGTCTLVRIRDVHLLLTAAHVPEHHKVTSLHVGGSDSLMPVTARFEVTAPASPQGDDPYDFAACRLSAEQLAALGDVTFIEDSALPKGTHFSRGSVFGCLGYPISKNKNVDATAQTVSTKLWQYTSYEKAEGISASRQDADPDSHLFIQFDEKKSRDQGGNTVNSIKPQGASGGPVFHLGNLGSGSSYAKDATFAPMLAGILTLNPEHGDAVRATRINVIIGALEKTGLL